MTEPLLDGGSAPAPASPPIAPAITICPTCGAVGAPAGGTCTRCGGVVDRRPEAPPASVRCPVCGTTTAPGRTSCAGCGLAVPGARAATAPAEHRRRIPGWQLAAATAVMVVLTALLLLVADGDDPADLDERWQVDLSAPAAGAPVISGDTALVATAAGDLVAVDARAGTPRWRLSTEQPVTAPVAAAGELAVLATGGEEGGGLVFGVDLRTGEERWRVETEAPVTDAPVLDDAGVYLARGDLSAHDLVTGEQRWRRPVAGGAGALDVGSGTVVAVGGDGIVALSAESGEVQWSAGGGRPAVAPGVVGDLVVVGGDGALVARALDRGQERWRAELGGRLLQPALPAPEVAVAVTTRGLVALDVLDGSERWQAGPSGEEGVRAGSDGTLLSLRTGGGVLAVDGLTGEVVGSARRRAAEEGGPGAWGPAITAVESLVVAEGDTVVALR